MVDGEESFAELFEASLKSPKKAIARRDPEVGEVVQGEVVQIGNEFAFLDIGAKAEALISLEELRGDDGQLTIKIGDKLEGHVVSVGGKEGAIVVSGRLQRGAGLRDQLQTAYEQGIPVEGLVTGVNKGGLDVDLGGVRAFLPISQIELRYCQDPSSYVGRALTLRVTRYDEDARNVVVSRRAILEVEQRAMAQKTREKLIPGAVFTGVVTAVKDYGAFVDIGGLEGLVHVSELGYGRSLRADEVVKPGQRVEVVVLKVEPEGDRGDLKISLSLKALMADPMDEVMSTLKEGDHVTGKVVRLEAFGAFVEIQPGAEGLIHISALSERHVAHPREVVNLGDQVTATVISVDRERRRIGLSLVEELRQAQLQAAATLQVGQVVQCTVERVEPYGAIVRVERPDSAGHRPRGTIPNAELNVPKGADTRRLFPEGRQVRALVQSIDGDGAVRLSIKAAELVEEHANIVSYSSEAVRGAGRATMEEMLRSKLGQAEKEAAPKPPKPTKARAAKEAKEVSPAAAEAAPAPSEAGPAQEELAAKEPAKADRARAKAAPAAIEEAPAEKPAKKAAARSKKAAEEPKAESKPAEPGKKRAPAKKKS
jgi:small subunit ribosomal protein S1